METSSTVLAIGLMSGTSLDGLDIAFIKFTYLGESWDYQFIHTKTIPYPAELLIALQRPFNWVGTHFAAIDESYCSFVAQSIRELLKEVDDFQPDFIASHGQTLFHQPEKGITFQLGSGSKIAAKTNIPCVSDFRSADVARGGQGAPLVPVGDQLLFSSFNNCVNIGGFANCSYTKNGARIAFDMVPANFVLNSLAERLGKPFDENGKEASKGELIPDLFKQLNQLDYYQLTPPKSLGAEFVNQYIKPILETYKSHSARDLLATFTEHIAFQIAENLAPGNCLLTGGGAKNEYLVTRLQEFTSTEVVVPTDELIDFKEALIFGLLGALRRKSITNVFASVTGAYKDHCAGSIHL